MKTQKYSERRESLPTLHLSLFQRPSQSTDDFVATSKSFAFPQIKLNTLLSGCIPLTKHYGIALDCPGEACLLLFQKCRSYSVLCIRYMLF